MCHTTDDQMCKCRMAVLNAYHGLMRHDPESVAIEAACRVYKFHHPEDGADLTRATVERWVHAGRPVH